VAHKSNRTIARPATRLAYSVHLVPEVGSAQTAKNLATAGAIEEEN